MDTRTADIRSRGSSGWDDASGFSAEAGRSGACRDGGGGGGKTPLLSQEERAWAAASSSTAAGGVSGSGRRSSGLYERHCQQPSASPVASLVGAGVAAAAAPDYSSSRPTGSPAASGGQTIEQHPVRDPTTHGSSNPFPAGSTTGFQAGSPSHSGRVARPPPAAAAAAGAHVSQGAGSPEKHAHSEPRTAASRDETSTTATTSHTSIGRVVGLAKPEVCLLLVGTLALLVSVASTLAIPRYFGRIIDDVGKSHDSSKLNRTVILLGIVFGVGAVATFARGTIFTLTGQRVVARLRKQLFRAIQSQEIGFFDKEKTGELINRLSSDTTVLQNTVTVNVSMALRWSVQVIMSIVLLFLTSWKLTLVTLSVVPAVAVGAVIYGKYLEKLSKGYQDALAKATDVASEVLGNIRTVRAFSMEERENRRYGDRIDETYRIGSKKSVAYGSFAAIVGGVSYGAILLVMWYGGRQVIHGTMTAGDLTSFVLYTVYIAVSLGGLSGLYGEFMNAVGASERVFWLIDRIPDIEARPFDAEGEELPRVAIDDFGMVSFPGLPAVCSGLIEFNDVVFSYPTRKDVKALNGVSFVVRPGSAVALVGQSGSGKSTIVSLLERFYDPDMGRICIDGFALPDVPTVWLRSQMTVVSQEPVLFATSIADNIAYGKGGRCNREDIVAAAKQANAHDFIVNFPDGYDTLVGERGVRLSGGQKQRVAIARALLMNPRILLLDEATSALDAESEALVQEAIDRLMENRTVLIIAHRLSTVRHAACVLVMSAGEIVERGTHTELIAADGVYKELVSRQLEWGTDGPSASGGSNSRLVIQAVEEKPAA